MYIMVYTAIGFSIKRKTVKRTNKIDAFTSCEPRRCGRNLIINAAGLFIRPLSLKKFRAFLTYFRKFMLRRPRTTAVICLGRYYYVVQQPSLL